MSGPFERAPRPSSVRRRQIEEWPGSVCSGGDNPGALLVCSRIDQTVCGRAGQRLLQLLAIKFEQLGDALRLAPCDVLKRAFDQRPAGLSEEVISSAFMAPSGLGNEPRRVERFG